MSLLRELFGPSQEEIWRQLSNELKGDFIEGGFWKGSKVQVSHGQWTITLDTYYVSTGKSAIPYTRLRAPFVNPDNFRFTVYRENLFSAIAKWLGMQDIEVGYPEFDRDFIIKGNDERTLRTLFANPRIRELISAQPQIHFTIKDDTERWFEYFPPDTDILEFHTVGIVKDIDRLKLLFALFSETMDQLCRMGSAYVTNLDTKE